MRDKTDIEEVLTKAHLYFDEVISLRNKGDLIIAELNSKRDILGMEIYKVHEAKKKLDLEFMHTKKV